MSENPTSDEIGETENEAENKDAGRADALDEGGYGGPRPENETETNDDDGS
ncbi:hypothetical protein BJ994_003406 [Arthrobacter pigmenti]|uniref:Uncharacterized protein n=1 Tax=Arthrobacter pigmenti TaxID=271432 RepID=A0A846RS04_9MICC|nr:hypothetical protein [Arthrobacter pigmenti]NJC24330.1 hypothetical protein [Arthrobacter pigmenti]